MGGAPPIKAHLTGHSRLAAQPAPREAAYIRARAFSTPTARTARRPTWCCGHGCHPTSVRQLAA